jgi:hypothetical protein
VIRVEPELKLFFTKNPQPIVISEKAEGHVIAGVKQIPAFPPDKPRVLH